MNAHGGAGSASSIAHVLKHISLTASWGGRDLNRLHVHGEYA